jgi:hypothetical protein
VSRQLATVTVETRRADSGSDVTVELHPAATADIRQQEMGPRKASLHLDLGAVAGAHEELPPVAALFLIHFDTKKGYNIAWSRTANGGT